MAEMTVSDIVTAVATVVLVGVTIWYAHTTREILKATNKPEILIFLYPSEFHPSLVNLCIQNIGTGFASKIVFSGDDLSFSPPLGFQEIPLNEMSIFKNDIDYLGPGKKIEIPLFSAFGAENLPQKSLKITVTYKELPKGETFDLEFTKWAGFYQDEPPIVSAAESLKSIASEIQMLLRYQR